MNWDMIDKILKILILISLFVILFLIKGCAIRDLTNEELRDFDREWERIEERRLEPPDIGRL